MKDEAAGRDSWKAVKIAGVLVVIIFFAVILYLQGVQERVGLTGPVSNISEEILNTQEAGGWISGCERKNPAIKDECTDLFLYELALKDGDKAICELIENMETRGYCIGYFKSVG